LTQSRQIKEQLEQLQKLTPSLFPQNQQFHLQKIWPQLKLPLKSSIIPKAISAAKLTNFSKTPPQPLKTSMPSLSKNEIKLPLQK